MLNTVPPSLLPHFADIVYSSFKHGLPLPLGSGILLCLPNPSKLRGLWFSLRPIVVQISIRKAISLVVLGRVFPAVDIYQSLYQSRFRECRSTVNVYGRTSGSAQLYGDIAKLSMY